MATCYNFRVNINSPVTVGNISINDYGILGTVKLIAIPTAGGGASIDIDSNFSTTSENPVQNKVITNRIGSIVDGSSRYPIVGMAKTTVSSVEGIAVTVDDGTVSGEVLFFADGVGLNAVKTAIEAQIPTGVVYVNDWDTLTQGYIHVDIGNDGYYFPDKDNFDQLETAVSGKVNTSSIKSTVTSGSTDPVNSVAVIAYINSLDATNTSY